MDKTGRTNPPGYDVKSEEKAPASPFLHQTKVSFEFTEYLGTSPAQFFLLLWVENISSIAQSPVRAKRVEDSSFIQPRRCSGLWERGAQWLVFLGDTKVRVPVEGSVPWAMATQSTEAVPRPLAPPCVILTCSLMRGSRETKSGFLLRIYIKCCIFLKRPVT